MLQAKQFDLGQTSSSKTNWPATEWTLWSIIETSFNSRMTRYLYLWPKILESQPVHTKLRKKLANTTYLWKFFPQLRCYFGSFSTTLQSNWPFETKLLASSCIHMYFAVCFSDCCLELVAHYEHWFIPVVAFPMKEKYSQLIRLCIIRQMWMLEWFASFCNRLMSLLTSRPHEVFVFSFACVLKILALVHSYKYYGQWTY